MTTAGTNENTCKAVWSAEEVAQIALEEDLVDPHRGAAAVATFGSVQSQLVGVTRAQIVEQLKMLIATPIDDGEPRR